MRTISKALESEKRERASILPPTILGSTTCYPTAPKNIAQELSCYEWYSDENRKEAAQNVACAFIASERDMPAQYEVRFSKALEIYDTDRVEKAISQARVCHPKAKLFALTDSARAPIRVQGENHLWAGQLLNEQFTLQRDDQLIPKEVMNRLHLLTQKGLWFEDGYALFSPYRPYEPPKKAILAEQYEMLKRDAAQMARAVKSMINTGGKMAGFLSSSVSSRLSPANRIPDPVLTGVIEGSLRDRRYFFIELGRWVNSD
jgi:hypothetical protein